MTKKQYTTLLNNWTTFGKWNEEMKKELADQILSLIEEYQKEPVSKHLWDSVEKEVKTKLMKEIEGLKKDTHKEVEKRFYFEDGNPKYKGEFELYGEYEPFFRFAKKIRNQALSQVLSILK